jgi:TolB protein
MTMGYYRWLVGIRRAVPLLVFYLLVSSVQVTTAQIRLEIPEPGGAGLPIAISPLASLDSRQGRKLGEEFAQVVARDLDISGYFRVLDQAVYIEGPIGFTLEEVNFGSWSVIGTLALVKGAVSVNQDSLTVEARLFDVAQRKQLGGRRYRGSVHDLRRMAHRFADQVLYYLTGEQGPFDSKIAFVSTKDGKTKEVYVTDLTGNPTTQITKNRTINLFPAWGPGARSLLFSSYKVGGPYTHRLDLLDHRESRLIAVNGFGGEWSPDGSAIAISLEQGGNSDLFLLSPGGQIRQRLTDHPNIDVSPSWSPDGREIAFCSDRNGSPQIYVVNINSGRLRRVTFSGGYNTSPAWSPKGDQLAYAGRAGRGFAVFTIPANGGEPRQLAAGEDPSWSPDGRYLVFSATRWGKAHLFVMTRDGRNIKQLTGGAGDDTSPMWSSWLP